MFKITTSVTALVLALMATNPAFAGGNTTVNQPSTPAAGTAAATFRVSLNASSVIVPGPDGAFLVDAGGVRATVSSAYIAGFLSVYQN